MRPDNQPRLAAYEKMLADVKANYAELVAQMDKLKAEKKEKSATFRQYWSNKMTCQYMLSMYRQYGLIENATQENEENHL